jgi:hypothetical protein
MEHGRSVDTEMDYYCRIMSWISHHLVIGLVRIVKGRGITTVTATLMAPFMNRHKLQGLDCIPLMTRTKYLVVG